MSEELNDRSYYSRRAANARQLANSARSPEVRAIHNRMAELYDQLCGVSVDVTQSADEMHFA